MVVVYTELVVREDLMQLYGFLTPAARAWHRLLTSVQGVGPRAALAIQGALDEATLGRAIALGDWASLRAAPGVGPKIAQRIVNELKEKAPEAMALADGGAPGLADPGAPPGGPGPGASSPRPRRRRPGRRPRAPGPRLCRRWGIWAMARPRPRARWPRPRVRPGIRPR